MLYYIASNILILQKEIKMCKLEIPLDGVVFSLKKFSFHNEIKQA